MMGIGRNALRRAPINLGEPITLASVDKLATVIVSYSVGMTTDLYLDEQNRYLYWADRGDGNDLVLNTPPPGFVARIALDVPGAKMETLVDGMLNDPVGVTIDLERGLLYFANDVDGWVFSAPLSGGEPTPLFKSAMAAGLILVDWSK
jgi:hypothetical protein